MQPINPRKSALLFAFRAAPLAVAARVILTLAVVLAGSGCVTANFTRPVASLKQSIDTAGSAIGGYYTELNRYERDLYLEGIACDPALRVEMTDANGNPTPLLGQKFSAESIKARMDAIALLGIYAGRLAELAGNSAPQKFSAGVTALGTNLSELQTTFADLGAGDRTARNYVGPVSQLIGIAGEMYLEKKREDLVKTAVEQGAPRFNAIVDLLEQDMVGVIEPLRSTGLKQTLAARVSAYNNVDGHDALAVRRKMTVAERRDALTAIQNAADQYDAFVASNPTGVITGMRDAHAALLKYAESKHNPSDFSELLSAVEAFQAKAERLAVAVRQIQALSKTR